MSTTKQTYSYTAYTAQSDGVTHQYIGTLAGAIRSAKRYAREAHPAWGLAGYGPTIVVRAANGTQAHRGRL